MLDFVWKVKRSFKKIRGEIENFKQNSNDWVVFLDEKNNEAVKRLDKIESRMDRLEEAIFRILSLRE
jgi:uncharacterized protein Yka (UPF0111/DUF47 family)